MWRGDRSFSIRCLERFAWGKVEDGSLEIANF